MTFSYFYLKCVSFDAVVRNEQKFADMLSGPVSVVHKPVPEPVAIFMPRGAISGDFMRRLFLTVLSHRFDVPRGALTFWRKRWISAFYCGRTVTILTV